MNTEPSLHVTGNEAVKRLHLFLLIAVVFFFCLRKESVMTVWKTKACFST